MWRFVGDSVVDDEGEWRGKIVMTTCTPGGRGWL